MIYIGNHVSVSKGYTAMEKEETSLGGNTFAFFTRNPRGGNAKQIEDEDMRTLVGHLRQNAFGPLVAHAPYTMNLCSAKQEVRDFSRRVFTEDLALMERLTASSPVPYPVFFNFHPGSHLGQGNEKGIEWICEVLNEALRPENPVIVLLETMAGKGTEIGGSFEELKKILDRIRLPEKAGVCLDTCHVWDAGYDIVNDPDGVLGEFDRIIGLDRLFAVHLNDSKNPRGSRKDRHARLGEGLIREKALERIVRHPSLQGRPFILETPNEDEGYRKEIAMVKSWMTDL